MDILNDEPVILPEPPQPDESSWRFVQDLQSPLWQGHAWRERQARGDEASLVGGVRIEAGFDDPARLLATAYDDLRAFLRAGNVPAGGGYRIITRRTVLALDEAYRIEVANGHCLIEAGDTEGVRRGIFHIEDLMLRAGGPFLPLGVVERTPVIRTRISRCFFGPINRPPKNRDELADEVNYYPDNYLNRLAHDGVNGLWLTVKFRDLCRSEIFPKFGLDSERRLEKLRQTVRRCARYGIKIFPFCIEPAGFGDLEYLTDPSHAQHHPEVLGHRFPEGTCFCPSSDIGRRYMEEATFTLFNAVPDLGGLIAIQLGERPTHCCSSMSQFFHNNCPRCSKRHPGEVFAEVWSAMASGIHRANPSAQFISWLYTPHVLDTPDSSADQKFDMLRQIVGYAIPQAKIQINFESGGLTEQFGRPHPIDDYSLSYIGPCDSFARCAAEIRRRGGRIGAKLQVANSHEVATCAYVPVPGNLYDKYEAMHRLGVSSAMQCWYFGNYPSPMTKAAGELSFAPLPASRDQFLTDLAAEYWPQQAPQVVQAWMHFQSAYRQFPAGLNFSWFGPVHDSVVWPLHLIPVDRPISPSWLLDWPASGDRVGECIGYEFTLAECLELCRGMAEEWEKGATILREVVRLSGRGQDQLNVAEAMGMQLTSTFHLLDFYRLREDLPRQPQAGQRQTIGKMRQLAQAEIGISRRLADLAQADSRLGFHSEAEGYKYFPEKLRWRAVLLEKMLAEEFPRVEARIEAGLPLFEAYTGQAPRGAMYPCRPIETAPPVWRDVPEAYLHGDERQRTVWQAVHDAERLLLRIRCQSRNDPAQSADRADPFGRGEHVNVLIESRRLGPSHLFCFNCLGQTFYTGRRSGPAAPWRAEIQIEKEGWSAVLSIPFVCLGPERTDRFRMNITRLFPGQWLQAWVGPHPLRPRLLFGEDNPADYGWLMIESNS